MLAQGLQYCINKSTWKAKMNCIMPMVEEHIFYKSWFICSHCLLGLNNISQLVAMKPNLKF